MAARKAKGGTGRRGKGMRSGRVAGRMEGATVEVREVVVEVAGGGEIGVGFGGWARR